MGTLQWEASAATSVCVSLLATSQAIVSAAAEPDDSSIQLVATVKDQYGLAMSCTAVSWVSSNPDKATVKDGLVRAVAPGSTVIRARVEGIASQPLTITVLPVTDSV